MTVGEGAPAPAWLTRADIEAVIEGMNADDLIEGVASKGDAGGGVLLVRAAFTRAAERLGYGPEATARVRGSDFQYLALRLGEVVNVESPLSVGTVASLTSATSGE